ncbi:GNAT family N-acetyltransferase [Frondihabitans australicus]|uniref:L-amino acid N-acyltransferase YncA n=1 Tax=Frondihabitans australicus TaxID=386892 RepID=A0A495IGB1_9MICO|nr:GNAT family N-acetyltransferase [Frondihabitans australicus]RKR75037.1 L-amino acid N-acyltransferase YncA [Frondihabitans australicus]
MSDVTVREATLADAEGIAEVHVASWREAYAHLLPPEFLASLDVVERADRWRRILRERQSTVLVAMTEDSAVGWASAGASRDADAPRALELSGLYVLAAHHGDGTGQRLLDAVIGDSPASLWVADRNPRAEAFYRRNGFARDGRSEQHTMGPHTIDAVRMLR